ncbi:polysaccharide lyase family 1 protein [Aplosporella prunicola CBS 121167]|uniref:Polysaccharide lyase family 1 protein n=1 Tax=Aplosporella prunicola CBS 121167 TaxID=1176127 RepID=A0A6A6BKW7_9PEZI|nr:polysaccharide lyase family 1 protein [Aplosporella prunicola CBS 121167]KAF2143497.1 polysaccharide lyase family 1 protein [Aplosporella prunicola CBS 121167]
MLLPCLVQGALKPYTGAAPSLPDRAPFGFGSAATGGGEPTAKNTYLVDNMPDLREALKMDTPRVVYVKGEIAGAQINASYTADCQYYIDEGKPEFNFTKYVQSYDDDYMADLKKAAEAGSEFEGQNATELLSLMNHQNGWRSAVQNVQKKYESIDVPGNLTLIGWDKDAYLHGVSLNFNVKSNIIMRNLRLSSPKDCFPAPETFPGSWNARYDAVSMVTTHTVWFDGNIFEDGPVAVAPEKFLGGWEVDRYDGMFDAEDGSDNITFSHNIVANHHKSLMWGGGEKEGDRDIGKMHFTMFGNHFMNSLSRNPLMRFGTFYILNNVFAMHTSDNSSYNPNFISHFGVYNQSQVLLAGNAFEHDDAKEASRIFVYSDLATPENPAKLCVPADLANAPSALKAFTTGSTLNGEALNLTETAETAFASYIKDSDDSVAGGLATTCEGFTAQEVPQSFKSADEVAAYVKKNAGQVGRAVP